MNSKYWKESDLIITHVRGSGPGGQHRNKRWTGIRVHHLPTGVIVEATERRSQAQNLSAALDRLTERLKKLFHKPEPRFATKPTQSSRKRRLQSKAKTSRIKKMRGRVTREEV